MELLSKLKELDRNAPVPGYLFKVNKNAELLDTRKKDILLYHNKINILKSEN